MQLTRRLGLLDAVHACVKRPPKEPSDSFSAPGQLEATRVGLSSPSHFHRLVRGSLRELSACAELAQAC